MVAATEQVKLNTLRSFGDRSDYRRFAQEARPHEIFLASETLTVPTNSPLEESQKPGCFKGGALHAWELLNTTRLSLVDLRSRGADRLLQDFHLTALCHSIITGQDVTLITAHDLTRAEAHQEIFQRLTSRMATCAGRAGIVSLAYKLDMFIPTPLGTESGIASLLFGHDYGIAKSIAPALLCKQSWGPERISRIIVDSRVADVDRLSGEGAYVEAVRLLDDSDGIEGNNRFTPDVAPIAEILSARHLQN